MVLTKDELIGKLQHKGRFPLHLLSKVDPPRLDCRLTAEPLQYLNGFGPIPMRAIKAGVWDLSAWRGAWQKAQTVARKRNLRDVKTLGEAARLNH